MNDRAIDVNKSCSFKTNSYAKIVATRIYFNDQFSSDRKQFMPLIFREKGYEFSFVMFDLGEPMHVHVRQGHKQAKYWIEPLGLAWMRGYRQHELNEIERMIQDNEDLIREIWQRESEKRS